MQTASTRPVPIRLRTGPGSETVARIPEEFLSREGQGAGAFPNSLKHPNCSSHNNVVANCAKLEWIRSQPRSCTFYLAYFLQGRQLDR